MPHEQPPTHNDHEPSLERVSPPSPRIYVASLADYNVGRLHGIWLDANRDHGELQADVRDMLADSPEPGAEEYAIHDYEGFGDARLAEYDSLELVSRIACGIAAHGPAFAAWARIQEGDEAALDRFEEAYLGHHESEQAYAEQLIDDLGYQQLLDASVPASLRPYARIDIDALARDMQLDGDLHFYPAEDGSVWVFDRRI